MQETWVQSLGWEDPLEKEMATHCSILAWENPRSQYNKYAMNALSIINSEMRTKGQNG